MERDNAKNNRLRHIAESECILKKKEILIKRLAEKYVERKYYIMLKILISIE